VKAFIRHIEPEDAAGELAEFYAGLPVVLDVHRLLSIRPPVAIAKEALREALLGESSSLGARRADLISTVVSGLNDCRF
jgi:hypothetical protein